MFFDPTKPAANSPLDSAEMRAQLTALKTFVGAILASPQVSQGEPGPQGDPGEVSSQQLDDAISGTSSNTNAVGTLDSPMADSNAEALRQNLDELILAARS